MVTKEETKPVIDEEEDFVDTYSFGGVQRWDIPGTKPGSRYYQFIEFKQMNEGDRLRYERLTNRDFKINRKTDEAVIRVDQGMDRHALIMNAVTGWNLYTRNPATRDIESMAFSESMLRNWLATTDPKLVDELADEIRKFNKWIATSDATEEDLEKEIAVLQEELVELRRKNEGKAG